MIDFLYNVYLLFNMYSTCHLRQLIGFLSGFKVCLEFRRSPLSSVWVLRSGPEMSQFISLMEWKGPPTFAEQQPVREQVE